MTLSLSDFAKAIGAALPPQADPEMKISGLLTDCLLYTSDAADD